MRVMTLYKRHLRGFSLIELAIVLGVMGIILGSIWMMAGDMRNNVKQEKFSEMLSVIVGNIRGNYAGKPYFDHTQVSKMMPNLVNLNVFPSDAVHQVSGGGVSIVDSPFGEVAGSLASPYNSIYVCGWAAKTSTACTYKTDTQNVPLFAIEALFSDTTSCTGAVLSNSSSATLPGLVAVYINGTPLAALPSDAVTANTACAANALKTVDFVYRLNP